MRNLIHVVGDSKFGGASRLIMRLAERARDAGWSVDVLTTDLVFKQVLQDAHIGVVDLDVIRRDIQPLWDVGGLCRLSRFLYECKYAVVHTHTSKGGFVGRCAASLARVPAIVHTVHGFAFHEASSPLEVWSYASLERLAARWCDRIVTVSHFHRDWALRLGIGDMNKVVAIPNGIPESQATPRRPAPLVRSGLGLKQGDVMILATGRLAPQKGLEYLLEATSAVAGRFGGVVKVFLAGSGPLEESLRRQSRHLAIDDQVTFLGFRSDIADLLSASDIVVLPSLREGLSIALLEAMAAGKAIIATAIGSNREVLEHERNALLVPPGSAEALADAVLCLARDSNARTRLGTNARKRYLDSYTEERMLDAYSALYDELYERNAVRTCD